MDLQLDQKDFQETVIGNQHVLIDFYADWCGPCQTLLPTIHKLADELQEEITIKKVNIDHNRELAAAFSVRSIPTLLQFTDGELVDRTVGLITENSLRAKISLQTA